MRNVAPFVSTLTQGALSLFDMFEIVKFETGHKAARVVFPVLDAFPDSEDPAMSYSWSNGKDMWGTLGNDNYVVFRDTSKKLAIAVC